MDTNTSPRLGFTLDGTAPGTRARACTFTTLHNHVRTPVFMPVATVAVLRTQNMTLVEELDFPVLLANTYHLLLRPGTDVFERFGGIHRFMNWPRSVLTDSGGFQVYSLPHAVKITDDGAVFKSYIDGRRHLLSPETSIGTQRIIGSDIMMAMDQCVPSTSEQDVCRRAVEITARWAERSLAARGDSPQALFGIVQGACSPELRRISAGQITSLPFDGYAIGGLAVGESAEERKDMTMMTAELLPADMPRYLMGVGTPLDLLEAVHRGVDMFDCILPTALAQQGVAFTSHGRIELRRGVYRFQDRPLDEDCRCPACSRYSRAYLHHLVKSGEYYASNLVGLHNLTYYHSLMKTMREHVQAGTFLSFYNEKRHILERDDDDHPKEINVPKKRKNTRSLGDYEVIQQRQGFYSIRHVPSGEIMHAVSDPVGESMRLYVDPAGIEKLVSSPGGDECVIWDVGLGAGTNALATIMEYERLFDGKEPARPLRIVSFERDLDSFRLSMMNASLFPHVRHGAPGAIAARGLWRSRRFPLEWVLLEGDFLDHMDQAPAPDVIYYDPFSLHTDGPLWSYPVFCRVFNRCASRPARLFTYSASTRVRSALLAAGFYVGAGPATGPKDETTAAISSLSEGEWGIQLLGQEWLDRWRRSDSKWHPSATQEERDIIERNVTCHPQFTARPRPAD